MEKMNEAIEFAEWIRERFEIGFKIRGKDRYEGWWDFPGRNFYTTEELYELWKNQ